MEMNTLEQFDKAEEDCERALAAIREARREFINRQDLNKQAKKMVDEMYKDGKSPLEQFGTSWDKLARFESDNPDLLTQTQYTYINSRGKDGKSN